MSYKRYQPSTTKKPTVNDSNHHVNFDTRNDSSEFSINDDSSTEREDGEYIFDEMDKDKKGECDYLTSYPNNYAVDEDMFLGEEMCCLRQREKNCQEKGFKLL